MVKQTLMLGETCLDDYVSEAEKLTQTKEGELSKLIEEIESKKVLENEQLPLKLLKIQKLQYPKINPSFLSMSNKKNQIQVPRFSVYKKTEDDSGNFEGFSDFYIDFFSFRGMKDAPTFFNWDRTILDGSYHVLVTINEDNELNELLEKPLINSLGLTKFFSGTSFESRYDLTIPIDLWKKYPKCNSTLATEFNGLIPLKIKEKIIEAEPIFEEEMYLITETKPEAWATERAKKRITKDPLLVGILEDDCYLIDHFDTTPIEHYVKSEFTE